MPAQRKSPTVARRRISSRQGLSRKLTIRRPASGGLAASTARSPRHGHFVGLSARSRVPFSFARGHVSTKVFGPLLAACQDALRRYKGKRHESQGTHEIAFRVNEEVPVKRTNGHFFNTLAPPALVTFVKHVLDGNPALCESLRPHLRAAYRHGSEDIPVFEADPKHALFAYATVKRWTDGRAHDVFHVDGGPSLFFLAVTIEGERTLEVEDAEGRRLRYTFRPGDCYASSPACFWHRVLPVEGAAPPSTVLLLRSALLTKRLSGGRERGDGSRTAGWVYATRGCFEELAPVAAQALAEFRAP